MAEIQLNVDGITCSGCVKGINQALTALPGFEDVEVDIPSGKVTVTGDAEKMSRVKSGRRYSCRRIYSA